MRTVVAKYPHAGLIDVGANIGDTLAVARSAADIPVVCVEGDPQCFAFLQQNIEQFERVSAHNVFLGEETERVSAQLQKEGWNTTIVPGDGTKKLSIIRFDEFANTLEQRDSLKILKIDAEGYDTIILRGAGEFLRDVRPALMFEYNRHNMHAIGEDGLGTLHWLGDLGYRKALFYEPKPVVRHYGCDSDSRSSRVRRRMECRHLLFRHLHVPPERQRYRRGFRRGRKGSPRGAPGAIDNLILCCPGPPRGARGPSTARSCAAQARSQRGLSSIRAVDRDVVMREIARPDGGLPRSAAQIEVHRDVFFGQNFQCTGFVEREGAAVVQYLQIAEPEAGAIGDEGDIGAAGGG